MRNAFIKALMDAAEQDSKIWLLTGDLGYSVLESFERRFPERYINVGIAEQNMTGVAAGLAMAGKTVVTYSIANFPTLRCLEQLRNDVCYHRLNVKVVAVGGGLAYGSLGYTHHAIQDLAIMRSLPGMAVAAPADPREAASVTANAFAHQGPVYLRLGKSGEPAVHPHPLRLKIGDPILVRRGRDLTLVSTGAVLPMVTEAAERLQNLGLDAEVISLPWVSPLSGDVAKLLTRTGSILAIEEHGSGGLFSALAELLEETSAAGILRSLRLPNIPTATSGSQDYLRNQAGLTVEAIVDKAFRLATTSRELAA